MLVVEKLIESIRASADYNPEAKAAPHCILWTDKSREWQGIVPVLQQNLPELLILGKYNPDFKTGPAIWLKCVIAKQIPELEIPDDKVPIVYLPGYSRQDLRVSKNTPEELKPLIELQFRGAIWSQINSKDWTFRAFLKTAHGGLGLDIANDDSTSKALQIAFSRLLNEEVDSLKDKVLDSEFFNSLLSGDYIKDILQWFNNPGAFKQAQSENEWNAFIEICKSKLGFNPDTDGEIAGAQLFAEHKGPWQRVWERFCEAPKKYEQVISLLSGCQIPSGELFGSPEVFEGFPQWNMQQEDALRKELVSLSNKIPKEARAKILKLESEHKDRRQFVWTELDRTPLAVALKHLAKLAEITSQSYASGTIEELGQRYTEEGWRADSSVMKSLSELKVSGDIEAVTIAIRSIYIDWLEESAKYVQGLVKAGNYPLRDSSSNPDLKISNNECLLFVDGLRFDVAKQLFEKLESFQVDEELKWSALPTVTATAKPAVAPVKSKISGEVYSQDFEPSVKNTYQLQKLLTDSGYDVLSEDEIMPGGNAGWCEFGDIDHEGHNRGNKFARYLPQIVDEIMEKVHSLMSAGWQSVRIITDHGWLFLPGGLPKIDLPKALVDSKWGRCAALKEGAKSEEDIYPWFWNNEHHYALANGINCYRNGMEYAHGGISLQECLTLELSISQSSKVPDYTINIVGLLWKGLRCNVIIEGNYEDLLVDIRSQAGNPSSSIALSTKEISENGKVSLVVDNEDLEGSEAFIVVMDKSGNLIAQQQTSVGRS
ncbi:BREX-1 system phosphatase PglZ type B [Bacteroidota bacterium]